MSQLVQLNFRLFGPRKGQTITINGHPFVDGHYLLTQSSNAVAACIKVLSAYGAFAKGTPQYDEALAKEEAANGTGEVHEKTEQGETVSVRSDVRQNGSGPSDEAPTESAGHAKAEARSAGVDSVGNGHEDTGIPKFEEAINQREPTEPSSSINEHVKAALLKLDPAEEGHWVKTGPDKSKPRLSAVETAYGKAGLTRQDLEAAIPGWNRDRATEAVLVAVA